VSILLNRSNSREAIPDVLRNLRDEWAGARERVWLCLDRLRGTTTIHEANEIRRELAEASRLFAPVNGNSFSPQRTLWEFCKGAVQGGTTAAILGGDIGMVAMTALTTGTTNAIPGVIDPLRLLNTSGAFDLARRVRMDLRTIEPGLLSHFLSEAERRGFGI